MENYLLGLDNGGTMVKAVIFDAATEKRWLARAAKLRMITPEASMTERDMEELWEANCQVIRRRSPRPWRRGGKNPRHCLLWPRKGPLPVGKGQ